MDLFNRLLHTSPLKAGQFGLAFAAAVLLLALWEVGKMLARRESRRESPTLVTAA
jgi:Ca2+-transporting ATPase